MTAPVPDWAQELNEQLQRQRQASHEDTRDGLLIRAAKNTLPAIATSLGIGAAGLLANQQLKRYLTTPPPLQVKKKSVKKRKSTKKSKNHRKSKSHRKSAKK